MERKNFRKLWAERTLNTALLRHWVGAIVLFCHSVLLARLRDFGW